MQMSAALAQFQHFSISGVGIGGAETERERSINDVHVGWMEKIAGSYVLTVVDICI
jgi:hypothetical protein